MRQGAGQQGDCANELSGLPSRRSAEPPMSGPTNTGSPARCGRPRRPHSGGPTGLVDVGDCSPHVYVSTVRVIGAENGEVRPDRGEWFVLYRPFRACCTAFGVGAEKSGTTSCAKYEIDGG